jgi:hypothetical protein
MPVVAPARRWVRKWARKSPDIRAKFDDQRRHKARYYQNAIRDLVAEGLLPVQTDVKAKADELFTYIMGRLMLARIENDVEPLWRDLKDGILRVLGADATADLAASRRSNRFLITTDELEGSVISSERVAAAKSREADVRSS